MGRDEGVAVPVDGVDLPGWTAQGPAVVWFAHVLGLIPYCHLATPTAPTRRCPKRKLLVSRYPHRCADVRRWVLLACRRSRAGGIAEQTRWSAPFCPSWSQARRRWARDRGPRFPPASASARRLRPARPSRGPPARRSPVDPLPGRRRGTGPGRRRGRSRARVQNHQFDCSPRVSRPAHGVPQHPVNPHPTAWRPALCTWGRPGTAGDRELEESEIHKVP
jgi:hypothetical protein